MTIEHTEQKHQSLEKAICACFGEDTRIIKETRVYGGDINDSCKLTLSGGEKVFVKMNSIRNSEFFTAESLGLRALASTGEIGVPKVLASGVDQGRSCSFLMLEYIESKVRTKEYWEVFGYELAGLHRAECSQFTKTSKYGFLEDNYIGANRQKNSIKDRWVDFYRECRLMPQIKMADSYLDSAMRKRFIRLLDHLEDYLREPEFPSLLHGDLWNGNVLCGNDGKAWILDPAVYVGDFETDIAMTQLFGGFPDRFYAAYNEINPIDKGYSERRNLYHLYHLLNHLNLFGGTYLGSIAEILNKF